MVLCQFLRFGLYGFEQRLCVWCITFMWVCCMRCEYLDIAGCQIRIVSAWDQTMWFLVGVSGFGLDLARVAISSIHKGFETHACGFG